MAAEIGTWSGLTIPMGASNCPADKRKVVGRTANGHFTATLLDGWETSHEISGPISSDGRFYSGQFSWPRYLSGWMQSPNMTPSQLVGVFNGNSFQGIVFSLSGGRSCDTMVYLLAGTGHKRERLIKQDIRAETGGVMNFEQIFYQLVENRSTSPLTTTAGGLGTSTLNNGQNESSALNPSDKLRIIRELLEEGLISAEEAAEKRKTILDEF